MLESLSESDLILGSGLEVGLQTWYGNVTKIKNFFTKTQNCTENPEMYGIVADRIARSKSWNEHGV